MRSSYVSSWQEISKIKSDFRNVLKEVVVISDNLAEVMYEIKEEHMGYHKNVHVIVYSLITSLSRVKLLKDMRTVQRLGGTVYYCDTGMTTVLHAS